MLQRLWNLCCSLKLAIVLSSLTTLLAIAGSLVMHFNPAVFGDLDALSLADWQSQYASRAPGYSLWVYLPGFLLALLALNTLCCFIDWLLRLRSRWRKAGEYLIHLGFVLIIIAYLWGSFAGSRSQGNIFQVGQTRPLPALPGHYLRLDAFEPQLNPQGRPVDMLNTLTLLKGDQVVAKGVARSNTPLRYLDLTIIPASFGQETIGYDVILPAYGISVALRAGYSVTLSDQRRLDIFNFYSDAVRAGDQVVPANQQTINPAIRARLSRGDETLWSGWHFLRQPLPEPLRDAGMQFVVRAPITRPYSVLTINADPGLNLALAGAISMTVGVCLALFSFYDKRQRGDHPEII